MLSCDAPGQSKHVDECVEACTLKYKQPNQGVDGKGPVVLQQFKAKHLVPGKEAQQWVDTISNALEGNARRPLANVVETKARRT